MFATDIRYYPSRNVEISIRDGTLKHVTQGAWLKERVFQWSNPQTSNPSHEGSQDQKSQAEHSTECAAFIFVFGCNPY